MGMNLRQMPAQMMQRYGNMGQSSIQPIHPGMASAQGMQPQMSQQQMPQQMPIQGQQQQMPNQVPQQYPGQAGVPAQIGQPPVQQQPRSTMPVPPQAYASMLRR